ncbi:MAG TPA: hypothetical protein VK671_01115 [Mucilaginibacter sp.]|jgi:hypothetical protein|nr:hypothetical protein [Mucilaginibacter sp.]
MKKLTLIASLLILASCTFTKQQKAEHLVKNYLKTHLDDPNSYESVNFSPVQLVIDKTTGKSAGWWEINHTYRAKNGFGGLIMKTECFSIDTTFSKAECCYTWYDYDNKTDMTKADTAR